MPDKWKETARQDGQGIVGVKERGWGGKGMRRIKKMARACNQFSLTHHSSTIFLQHLVTGHIG